MNPTRIWIDTDIGSDVDDALAVAYALRHPGLELVGVSTVFGDVALRSRIAEELLRVADASHIPVVTGLGAPGSPGRKGVMFGHEGIGIVDDPAPVTRVEEDPDREWRTAALADAVQRAEPDVMLAIGPLTNLGALVAAGAPLPPLSIMGGKLSDEMLPGMLPEIPEWNWFCDPVAVQQVVGAANEALPRVVPAEVTFRTRLDEGDVERLADGDALARVLSVLCGHWLTAQRELLGSEKPGVALHDPLAAAILVEPDLCRFEQRRIAIDDNGATTPAVGPDNVDAAVDVEARAVRDHLMATLLG